MNSQNPANQSPPRPVARLSAKARQRCFIAMSGTAVVLGFIGFLQLHHSTGQPTGWSDALSALYQTVQLFVLEMSPAEDPLPPALEVARWLAAATTLLAGVTVVGLLFRSELEEWRLSRMRDHVVICGLGRKGMAHLRRLAAEPRAIAVIDNDPEPEYAEECQRLRVPIVTGDATRRASLMAAGTHRAAELYAFCPDDATNCEVAAQAGHLQGRASGKRLKCHIQLSDVDLRAALQQAYTGHADEQTGEKEPGRLPMSLRFFDVFEPEARQLLVRGLPLDHDGVPFDSDMQVHLVILGFGRMGSTLAVRAAQLGCFANRRRLRISVIDRHAGRQRDALLFRHRYIEQVCEMEYHAIEAISPRARELLEGWCADPKSLTSVAVCFDNEPRALELSSQLLPLMERTGSRLAIRLAGESGLAHLLSGMPGKAAGFSSTIRVFGMEDRWYDMFEPGAEPNETFARRIHTEYQRLKPTEAPPAATGTGAVREEAELAAWLELPEDFRESSRQQAAHIFIKLRAIGCEAVPLADPCPAITRFEEHEIQALAAWEHERWMCERQVANWTFKEGKKDPVHRTNPNMREWSELPEDIRNYDVVFVRLIPELLQAAGLKICRRTPPPAVASSAEV